MGFLKSSCIVVKTVSSGECLFEPSEITNIKHDLIIVVNACSSMKA